MRLISIIRRAFQHGPTKQEQLSTLQFFLNTCIDVTKLPPTKDYDLRIMQECDVLLLAIFDRFCKQHDIEYWLDAGTLLGAVRHSGFIPWDDDLDVSMRREDYQKFIIYANEFFDELGIEVKPYCDRYGLGYKHETTGVWLDIFPYDEVLICDAKQESVIPKFIARYQAKMRIGRFLNIKMNPKRHRTRLFQNLGTGTKSIWIFSVDFGISRYMKSEYLFPLKEINFEGRLFPAPADERNFLTICYGRNYMGFPRSGVLHHDLGRGALSTWAKKNGVDMEIIKKELEHILETI